MAYSRNGRYVHNFEQNGRIFLLKGQKLEKIGKLCLDKQLQLNQISEVSKLSGIIMIFTYLYLRFSPLCGCLVSYDVIFQILSVSIVIVFSIFFLARIPYLTPGGVGGWWCGGGEGGV